MRNSCILMIIFFVIFSFRSEGQNILEDLGNGQNLEWTISSFLAEKFNDIQINGNPKLVNAPYGKAVYFDGDDDAFFLDFNPLQSFEEFTIEMIFNPSMDGDFEQRVVHMGEVSGDRMLLEIRAINGQWYFDGFAASGENKLALIDENLIHPLGKWYHVAFVVTSNSLTTYVNGKKELEKPFSFKSIDSGRSSIGVRLNERSWFKGSIYKIKITPEKLDSHSFIDY